MNSTVDPVAFPLASTLTPSLLAPSVPPTTTSLYPAPPGNSGPGPYTAANIAPWILIMGASTIDWEFPTDVKLGDDNMYGGVSLYSGDPLDSIAYPLVYAGDVGSRLCLIGHLNQSNVSGKIVVCDCGGNARVEKGSTVKLVGGVGMIMANTDDDGEELLIDSHLNPAYVKTDLNPMASIVFWGMVFGPSSSSPRDRSFTT